MSEISFDANAVEPSAGFDLMPAGKYTVIIEASEKKPTKAGTGSYLQFTLQVIEGNFKGRKLWSRINFTNPNQQAQNIGRAELSALCRAVGVMTPKATEELHSRPFTATVTQEKRSDNGEMTNVVTKFEKLDGNIQGAVTDGSSKPAAQAAASSTPPWKK